jgi:transcription initiation factor TFIIIB Brf1 subunit/transcription initiation factor TFIIB
VSSMRSEDPTRVKWRRRSLGLDQGELDDTVCPSCEGDMVRTKVSGAQKLVCSDCGYTMEAVSSAFDAWKHVKSGRQEMPPLFEGRSALWETLAKRVGHSSDNGVVQQYPVIGGRRRYHHRPLTSWKLSNRRTLTLTSDEMEAKVWNKMKGKNVLSFPTIWDVFSVSPKDAEKVWAIVHEPITYPIPADWEFFVDSLFKWRAMQHGGLAPVREDDIVDFLRYILDPEVADPKTLKRARVEHVLPWKTTKSRRKETDTTRTQLLRDQTLQEKVQWAKAAIKYLAQAGVKFRDFDPSNLGVTDKGEVVIVNVAESRSLPTTTGRMGKISGSVGDLQRTASAINVLLEGEETTTMSPLSGETRYLLSLVHEYEPARDLVTCVAFGGNPIDRQAAADYINELARRFGGKANKLAKAIKK